MSIFNAEKGIVVRRESCANDPAHPRPLDSGECPKCQALFCEDCFIAHVATCKAVIKK